MKFIKATKLLSLCLVLTLLTSLTAFASATENINVSTQKPTEYTNNGNIVPYGTSKPSSKWDLAVDGRYSFSGSAEVSTLYTNVKFTKNSSSAVTFSIYNNSSSTLTVKLIKDGLFDSTVKTWTISGNCNDIFVVSPETMTPGTYYYLSFSAPSNFSGHVE